MDKVIIMVILLSLIPMAMAELRGVEFIIPKAISSNITNIYVNGSDFNATLLLHLNQTLQQTIFGGSPIFSGAITNVNNNLVGMEVGIIDTFPADEKYAIMNFNNATNSFGVSLVKHPFQIDNRNGDLRIINDNLTAWYDQYSGIYYSTRPISITGVSNFGGIDAGTFKFSGAGDDQDAMFRDVDGYSFWDKVYNHEIDQTFTTWLASPPIVSSFTNDADYITSTNLSGYNYAQYQFANNNFNGTGNFTTLGSITANQSSFIYNGLTSTTFKPSVVSTTPATAGISPLLAVFGAGGNCNRTTSQSSAGVGAGVSLTLGNGGAHVSNVTGGNSFGGAGGGYSIVNGNGGTSNSTNYENTGGNGGSFQFTGGNGGNLVSIFTSMINTAGTGGSFSANAGNGGFARAFNVSNNTGGNGGNFGFTSGSGGLADRGNATYGGHGGTMSFVSGGGGSATLGVISNQSGNGGNITFNAGGKGAGTTLGSNGAILFGTKNGTGGSFVTRMSIWEQYVYIDLLNISNTLNVGNNTNVKGNLTCNSNAIIGGTLNVSNNVVIYGNLSVKRAFYYGYDNSTQTNCGTTCANIMNISNNDDNLHYGITVKENQNLTFDSTGVYICDVSPEFYAGVGLASDVGFWYQKNGVDVPWSNSRYTLDLGKYEAPTIPFAFEIRTPATDNVRFMWMSGNANTLLYSSGVLTLPNRPSVPAVIINCRKSSEVI